MILVTGGTGFIGRHVVAAGLAAGRRIRCLCRPGTRARQGWPDGIEVCEGDLCDAGTLAPALDGCTQIVHLAGLAVARPSELQRTNVGGTVALCAAAAKAGVGRLLHVSSLQAHERFDTEYGKSKRQGERAVAASGLDWTILRPAQIYGPGDAAGLTRVAIAASRGSVLPLPAGGRSLVQPAYVGDLVQAIYAALDRPVTLESCYEIGGPQVLSLREFIDCASRLQGRSARSISVPEPLIRAVAHLTAIWMPWSWLAPDVLRLMAVDKTADIAAACRDLDYAPLDVTSGLEVTFGLAAPNQNIHGRSAHAHRSLPSRP